MEAGSVPEDDRSLGSAGYLLDVSLVFDKAALQNYYCLQEFRDHSHTTSEADAFSSALQADDFEAVLDQAPFSGIHARGRSGTSIQGRGGGRSEARKR